jgi:hypothetical protein
VDDGLDSAVETDAAPDLTNLLVFWHRPPTRTRYDYDAPLIGPRRREATVAGWRRDRGGGCASLGSNVAGLSRRRSPRSECRLDQTTATAKAIQGLSAKETSSSCRVSCEIRYLPISGA